MIIYGASGHAKVIMDCLKANQIVLKAVFDDNPNIRSFLGHTVIHDFNPDRFRDEELIIAIGNNQIRKNISEKLRKGNPPPQALKHPTAILSPNVNIGPGTVVLHNATIQASTTIGEYVIINTGATVDHDCILSDFVHVAPNATLCGGVEVGEGTLIGAGSVVIPNIRIGKWCVIGAGSVVIKDVPDYATVVGNPGKLVRISPK